MSQDYARVPNYRQGALARRPGYTSGRVSEDGTSVFYESIIPPNARGVVIISPGLKPVASSAMPTLMERLVDRGIGSLWLLYEADTPFYVRERKCRIAVERAALPLHLPLAGFGVSSGASVLLHLAARTDFFRGVGLKSIVGNYLASYRTVQGLSERARSEVFPFSINDYGSSRPDFFGGIAPDFKADAQALATNNMPLLAIIGTRDSLIAPNDVLDLLLGTAARREESIEGGARVIDHYLGNTRIRVVEEANHGFDNPTHFEVMTSSFVQFFTDLFRNPDQVPHESGTLSSLQSGR